MTAMAVARRPDARAEWQSFLAVVATAIIAVAAGVALLAATDHPSRQVERDGVTADIPAGWILTEPVGDLLFSAYDPMEPDRRYTVAAVPAVGGTPEDAALLRVGERRPLLPGFEILENGAAAIGDVATHRLRYTFAAGLAGSSELVEVREDYVADGERVLIVGLEAPREGFAGDEAAFDRFARQVVAGRAAAAAVPPAGASLDRHGLRVASAAGPALPPVVAPAAAADLVAATVQVFVLRVADDLSTVAGHGSGTVVSADGLILTNAHVAKPSAGGHGIRMGEPTPPVDPAGLVVAIIEDEASPAVPRYFASVVAADGYLDAALIRIDRTLDGAPVAAGSVNLPFLPIGDSDALGVGDELTVVGYPAIGGNTISLSAGLISGFLGDPRIGDRAWLKTDAIVSQGNSGGLAANAAGELVGIPTMVPEDTGGYSLVRPIALVRPMLDDALAGRPSLDSRYTVASTGTEQYTFDTWTDDVTAECGPVTRLETYPSGTREIIAIFNYTGVADGEDRITQWSVNGELIGRIAGQFPAGASAGGCIAPSLSNDRGLPDGVFRVEVFVGPTLRPIAVATTAVGTGTATPGQEGQPGASTVSGRVVDVDSGQPISGAVVFVLRPGTDAAAWARSPDAAALVSYGQSGSDGRFQLPGLTGGVSYPVIVVAEGYHAVSGGIGPVPEGQSDLESDVKLLRAGP